MSTELKRISFAASSDIEEVMDEAKKIFYNKTQSDMIRILLSAGINAAKQKKLIGKRGCK